MLDYDMIPVEYMKGAVQRYIEQGISPGGFLTAVICNNLSEGLIRADENNGAKLKEWVQWFYSEAPSPCWGSKEKMEVWMNQRRKALTAPPEVQT